MPIRIKPHYDLKPCILDLSSIEEISDILVKYFPDVKFSANRGALQIYDEPKDSFIKYISNYDSIDSFSVEGQSNIEGSILVIKMVFDEEHASVSFVGSLEHNNWIEHFITDVKKKLHEPSLRQKFSNIFREGYDTNNPYKTFRPYCKIVLKKKQASLLIENIKANILSNIIWVILGMIILYILQLISRISGFNLISK